MNINEAVSHMKDRAISSETPLSENVQYQSGQLYRVRTRAINGQWILMEINGD